MAKQDHWKNCLIGQEVDSEIVSIDGLGEKISPVPENILKIRGLISNLEMCHHKAEKWVLNILEAISTGQTNKGLGTREPGQPHPRETVSKNAIGALSAWVAGCPVPSIDFTIGTHKASEILACLGVRTPLKEWQVQRVIDKIRSWTDWPGSDQDPSTQYIWLAYNQGSCPEYYQEHEAFWRQTMGTLPFDDLKGLDGGAFSLGFAIDLLWTCHWNFVENLHTVLQVIGGNLLPGRPFAACAWNIALSPIRPRMQVVSNSLKVFCGEGDPDERIDINILTMLGEATDEKKWLAASLEKTMRLQLKL